MTDAAGQGAPETDAARRLLDADGRAFVLQPWQVAYLIALVEGRTPVVPPGCGVGRAWLEARLREARSDLGASS
ncbi:MAG: hypothetical protein EPO36_12400 [Chloroflexota bacterium]|nr:MAG: hypothetical protein EPO36_12400 [Chloroflexota bacterium]